VGGKRSDLVSSRSPIVHVVVPQNATGEGFSFEELGTVDPVVLQIAAPKVY